MWRSIRVADLTRERLRRCLESMRTRYYYENYSIII
jgi:hypothetical protein